MKKELSENALQTWRNLKTPPFRFRVDGKHFENDSVACDFLARVSLEHNFKITGDNLASHADVLRLVTRSFRDKPKNVCVGG